jgi:hypothetical protein
MADHLHPATRAIISASDPERALQLARELATHPPDDWSSRDWETIAASGTMGRADARWHAVAAFAREFLDYDSAAVDALRSRAWLIATLGPDATDPFRSLQAFVDGAARVLGAETPDAARGAYANARRAIVTVPRDSPEWLAARDTFLRCRRLRELARVFQILRDASIEVPAQLEQWKGWEDLREEELEVA